MSVPLSRGWLLLLLSLPLVAEAQSSDETSPLASPESVAADTTSADTLVVDTMRAIAMPEIHVADDWLADDWLADDWLADDSLTDVLAHEGFSVDRALDPPSYPLGVFALDAEANPAIETLVVDSALSRAMLRSAREHLAAQEVDLALDDFGAALAADPMNVDALNGYGHTSAWSGRHDESAEAFQRALSIDPGNLDAAKGLAYLAHWRGRNDEAAARFGALAAEHPDDRELASMHARALLEARRLGEARAAYEKVLALDPEDLDARAGLEAARTTTPKVELTSWLGATWYDDEERPRAEGSVGIRFVEVAIWPSTTSRIWFQYDNGLTLDNVVLASGNRAVPAGYIGGFLNYGPRRVHTTRLELGWRSLPGSIGQTLLRGEHVLLIGQGISLKGGLWLGVRTDDRNEWVMHGGLTIPLFGRLQLDPTFFFANNGMRNEKEWRILLAGEYRFPSGVLLAGGLAGGQASTGYIDDYRAMSDRYLKVSLPFGRANRAHALLRTEFVGETDATTVLAVGVTIGLSER